MDATTIQAGASAAFDLAQYEAAETSTLEVQNKKDDGPLLGTDGLPVTIELFGPGSEQYVKVQAEIDRANQERVFQAVRGRAPKDAAAEARANQVKKLVACTKSISANFPVTPADLHGNRKLGYISAQVSKHIEDWANF